MSTPVENRRHTGVCHTGVCHTGVGHTGVVQSGATTIKAITILQPWAWLIVHGLKQVENRTWSTAYRGPLVIHAGKSRKSLGVCADRELLARAPGLPAPDDFVFGAAVGVVDLVDIVTPDAVAERQAFWATGPMCWVLERPRAIEVPFPMRGQLSLFDPGEQLRTLIEGTGDRGK